MCEGHHHDEGGGCGCCEGHSHQEGEQACKCGGHHGQGQEHGGGCSCGRHPRHDQEGHCTCGCHHDGGCRCGGGCGCHRESQELGFQRRFRTRAEQIAELETYLNELEAEAQGVREAIAGLRGPQPSQPSQT